MEILIILGWGLIGVFSFVFWWTKDYDFTSSDILAALLCGIIGPVAFLICGISHFGVKERVIMKKRNNK